MDNDITIERWQAASDGERERFIFDLLSLLPKGFAVKAIRRCALANQAHFVAFFSYRSPANLPRKVSSPQMQEAGGEGATWLTPFSQVNETTAQQVQDPCGGDSEFALIPGGIFTLGYDPAMPFQPSKAQLTSWQETVEYFKPIHAARGLQSPDPSLDSYIQRISSPLRTIKLAPYLVEVNAREAGVEPMSLADPKVLEWSHQYRDEWPCTVETGRCRVRFGPDGPVEAYRIQWMNGEQALSGVQAEGFRLPTADEFEHACRSGSRTLFRWGDETPDDEEPNPLVECPSWSIHRMPSAFGVNICQNPYAYEFVMKPTFVCGGDGGHAIHSGQGYFVSWLTLSSAFRHPSWGSQPMPGACFRRVLPLPSK